MKIFFVILSCFLFFSGAVWAQEQTGGDYFVHAGTKLGRGIENIVTSPAEIPCAMEAEMQKGDRIVRFFSGLGKGTVFFARRVLLGAAEVATFVIPMERTLARVCREEPAGVIG